MPEPLSHCLVVFRPTTHTILHTHSVLAVLASLLDPTQFSASNLQMVKAMPGHKWSDQLRLPIINNQDSEAAIAVELETAVRNNPGVDAVLIRGHGLYVWASSWQAAKVSSEGSVAPAHIDGMCEGAGRGLGMDISSLRRNEENGIEGSRQVSVGRRVRESLRFRKNK